MSLEYQIPNSHLKYSNFTKKFPIFIYTIYVTYRFQFSIIAKLVLIKCVKTRWNAFFKSAERFVANEKALRMFFAVECKQHALTDDEWILLKEVIKILRPLYNVTKELSAER